MYPVVRRPAAVCVVAVATAAALAGCEMALRKFDGYSLRSVRLVRRVAASPVTDTVLVHQYVDGAGVSPGVDRAWFDLDPDVASGAQADVDRDLLDIYTRHGNNLRAIYEWNTEYLHWLACVEPQTFEAEYPALGDLFVFSPPSGTRFPIYRFLRNARYPDGLVTNSFGWRGPEPSVHKADDVVRIVFVGASTTVNPHTDRFSYPEYIGRWLNHWAAVQHLGVRFDVLNAAREGIDSRSIAVVFSEEVAPLDPDLVVYYEGSNQFWPVEFSPWPGGTRPKAPRVRVHAPSRLEQYSATAVRLRSVVDRTIRSEEPAKPSLPVRWPPVVDEYDPDLESGSLPLSLPIILQNLDAIRGALEPRGGVLALSSFVWCVYDGMKLNVADSRSLFDYLNVTFWPFTYRHMRRFIDFQNRVFKKYAHSRDIPFLDVAARVPMDPRLFGDAIHLHTAGVKLMAWSSFQELQPIVAAKILDGAWPRRSTMRVERHPVFATPTRTVMPASAFRGPCQGAAAR
jgi:hypothetical protein